MCSKELKEKLFDAIDNNAALIKEYFKDIEAHPELGFEEFYTSERMQRFFKEIGLSARGGLAVTGVEAVLDSGNPGPTIAMIGELDAIICRGLEHTDPVTGAAHQCGHHVQQSVMLAVATAFAKSGVIKELSGRIKFLGTPAEEAGMFDAIAFKKEGKIHLLTGKAEMIREGVFDDVDMAMQMHCWSHAPGPLALRIVQNLGTVGLTARYHGKQAHSASEAFNGVNALYAALTGVNMVHMLREGFNDQDHPRIHCVLTEGGSNPNSIPDLAQVECFVKANNFLALEKLIQQVIRALKAGANIFGAEFELSSIPGMLPMRTDDMLSEIYMKNSSLFMSDEYIKTQQQQFACSDLGDVAQLMPILYPQAGGVDGTGHGTDFRIVDFNNAVIIPAKTFAATICDVLCNDAKIAREVVANHSPAMTKEEYLALMESYFSLTAQ